MLEKGRGQEDQYIDQRRADIGCAQSVRAAESFRGGPNQETEERATKVGKTAGQTEEQPNGNRGFNQPGHGSNQRG